MGDTRYTDNPICPHCGKAQADAWDLGPCGEGDRDATCGSCGADFGCTRHVSVSYSSTAKTNAQCEKWAAKRKAEAAQ